MADLIVNLDFIPLNLDGAPLLGHTLAKEVGRVLCESKGSSYSLEKYSYGKTLFDEGFVTFNNIESVETQATISFFKSLCDTYPNWSNDIKGQILQQFNS